MGKHIYYKQNETIFVKKEGIMNLEGKIIYRSPSPLEFVFLIRWIWFNDSSSWPIRQIKKNLTFYNPIHVSMGVTHATPVVCYDMFISLIFVFYFPMSSTHYICSFDFDWVEIDVH